jgi:hypothetical protein
MYLPLTDFYSIFVVALSYQNFYLFHFYWYFCLFISLVVIIIFQKIINNNGNTYNIVNSFMILSRINIENGSILWIFLQENSVQKCNRPIVWQKFSTKSLKELTTTSKWKYSVTFIDFFMLVQCFVSACFDKCSIVMIFAFICASDSISYECFLVKEPLLSFISFLCYAKNKITLSETTLNKRILISFYYKNNKSISGFYNCSFIW